MSSDLTSYYAIQSGEYRGTITTALSTLEIALKYGETPSVFLIKETIDMLRRALEHDTSKSKLCLDECGPDFSRGVGA